MRRLITPTSLIIPCLLTALILCPAAMAFPSHATITVKVLNPDGSPAANTRVVLQNGNYIDLNNGMTNDSGVCVFTVYPGSSAIRAFITSPEYNVTSAWYEAGDTGIEVRLPEVGEVSGNITLGGMGAGNPLVVLDDGQIFDSTPHDVSRQNSSDLYTFTVNRFSFTTTLGSHRLYAVGYSNDTVYMSDPLTISVSAINPQVLLELKPMGKNASALSPAVYDRIFHASGMHGGPVSVAGTLVGADGRPLANATLTAQDYFLKEPGTTITGPDGTFSFGSISPSTDLMRFKAVMVNNGTTYTSYSTFYPAQNYTGLTVNITDYPMSAVGYIYGIITMSGNLSSPVPVSGTVHLSNRLAQDVSVGKNNSQFFFTVPPGPYDIYAEHADGRQRLVSKTVHITVAPEWSPTDATPTILVLEPEKVQYIPLTGALVAGIACIVAIAYALRKWL